MKKSDARCQQKKTDADEQLSFDTAPALIVSGQQVGGGIGMRLTHDGDPTPGVDIAVTLPPGFYNDNGGSGEQIYTTDAAGAVNIRMGTFSAMGQYVITARSGEVEAMGKLLVSRPGVDTRFDFIYALAVSKGGVFVYLSTADWGGGGEDAPILTVLDTRDNTLVPIRSERGYRAIFDILLSPDGSKIYAFGGELAFVIDDQTREVLYALPTPNGQSISSLSVSADGQFLYLAHSPITHYDPTIAVFSTTDFQLVKRINGPLSIFITELMLCHPDGRRLYTCIKGPYELIVIDLETEAAVQRLPLDNSVRFMKFSKDGKYLYMVYASGRISLLNTLEDIYTEDWLALGSEIIDIDQSSDGKNLYLLRRARVEGPAYIHELLVVNTETKQIHSVFQVALAWYVVRLALDPDEAGIYITNGGGGIISGDGVIYYVAF